VNELNEIAEAHRVQTTPQRSFETSARHSEDVEFSGASPGDSVHSEGESSAHNKGIFRTLRRFVLGSSSRKTTGRRSVFLGRLGVRREISNSPSMTTRLATEGRRIRSASRRGESRESLSDT
jgi:hypothetical protein